jgi:hypothetical protein
MSIVLMSKNLSIVEKAAIVLEDPIIFAGLRCPLRVVASIVHPLSPRLPHICKYINNYVEWQAVTADWKQPVPAMTSVIQCQMVNSGEWLISFDSNN